VSTLRVPPADVYRGVTQRRVDRLDLAAGTRAGVQDDVADEAALVVTARGQAIATLMRTPGDDVALVRGLLFAEAGPAVAARAMTQAGPHQVDVDAAAAELPARAVLASAACGVCGRIEVAALEGRARAVAADWQLPAAVIAAIPAAVRAEQPTFATTGGLHAAALCDRAGRVLAVAEDVGRHNAVDKVVGWALRQGRVPLPDTVLFVSGRASFELVQKAVLAGIGIVAAVSAPSSLAVELAEQSGLTLVGFLRDHSMNVYTHPQRVA